MDGVMACTSVTGCDDGHDDNNNGNGMIVKQAYVHVSIVGVDRLIPPSTASIEWWHSVLIGAGGLIVVLVIITIVLLAVSSSQGDQCCSVS